MEEGDEDEDEGEDEGEDEDEVRFDMDVDGSKRLSVWWRGLLLFRLACDLGSGVTVDGDGDGTITRWFDLGGEVH